MGESRKTKKSKRRKRNGHTGAVLGIVAVLLAGACIAGYFYLNSWKKQNAVNVNTCYNGVYVDEIHIGGMTREEAKAALETKQQERIAGHSVTAVFEDLKWEYTMQDVAYTFNTDEVLNEAFNLGREGTVSERYAYIQKLETEPVYFTTELSIDASPLQGKAQEIADALYVAPTDANIVKFDPKLPEEERFEFQAEQVGRQADTSKLFTDLKQAFESQTFDQVQIAVETVQPEIKLENLKGYTQKISSFSTTMKKDSNRESNIELASNAISGTILMPGETFSFNETTGERSAAKGYKVAGIISAGEPDEGLGGGVCQVSGTLFNSVVMADLTIVSRTRHSYVLGYLPGGRDATVDYPRLDLKFRNDKDTPVYLVMYADRQKLTVTAEVYGAPLENGATITLDAVTTAKKTPGDPQYIVDTTLTLGQTRTVPARTGYNITVYKVYKSPDGAEVRREVLHKDSYPAIAQKIYVAKGGLPTDPTPTPVSTPAPTLAPEAPKEPEGGEAAGG
ncbi:MAG: VanW family protein [Eubacteriales bacterium]|nr:VanW family protein [Eubacteriales bacterium]